MSPYDEGLGGPLFHFPPYALAENKSRYLSDGGLRRASRGPSISQGVSDMGPPPPPPMPLDPALSPSQWNWNDQISAYVKEDSAPWNSQRLVGEKHRGSHSDIIIPPSRKVPSEMASSMNGKPPSFDSGYCSQTQETDSIFSRECREQGHETSSLADECSEPGIYSNESPDCHDLDLQPVQDGESPISCETTIPLPTTCQEDKCGKTFKNQSEARKHLLKHTKPYECSLGSCKAAFPTSNDRDRHRKSKHKVCMTEDDKFYMCKAPRCRNPKKIWDRLDNFKSHLYRIHEGEQKQKLDKDAIAEE